MNSHVDPPKKIQKTPNYYQELWMFFTDIHCTFSFFHYPKDSPHFFQLSIPQVGHPFPDKGHLQARVDVPTFPGEVNGDFCWARTVKGRVNDSHKGNQWVILRLLYLFI